MVHSYNTNADAKCYILGLIIKVEVTAGRYIDFEMYQYIFK